MLSNVCSIHIEAIVVLRVVRFTIPECCEYSFICCFTEGFQTDLKGAPFWVCYKVALRFSVLCITPAPHQVKTPKSYVEVKR